MAHKSSSTLPPLQEATGGKRSSIKMVSAIIRPERLDAVKEALNKLNLVDDVTLTTVRGFGHQRGSVEHYMGVPYTIRFMDKVKIEMAVPSDDVNHVVTLISQLAHTGRVGDGKIFVTDVNAAMRIRTGERGIDAL